MNYEPDKRISLIGQMRKNKKTYRVIGKLLGVSCQRVYQIEHAKPKYDFSGIKLTGRDFLKEKRRIIDNYTCQICGKKWVKGTRRLDVHHIKSKDEGLVGKKYSTCKNLNHLITLCHLCHLNLKSVRNKIKGKRK